MTAIPAKVLAVHRRRDQYHVAVRIGFAGSTSLLSEKTDRSPVLVATVGLTLSIIKTPASKRGKNYRSGLFNRGSCFHLRFLAEAASLIFKAKGLIHGPSKGMTGHIIEQDVQVPLSSSSK
jgi:hypothetical protein